MTLLGLTRLSRDIRDFAIFEAVSRRGRYTIHTREYVVNYYIGDTRTYSKDFHIPNISEISVMGENPEVEKYIKALNEEKARSAAEKQALIEEFTKTVPLEWSPEDLKEKMYHLVAKAYACISLTIDNQDEPALAFQASKYVMGIGIGATKITDANDPNKEFTELIKGLAKKTPQDTAASNANSDTKNVK